VGNVSTNVREVSLRSAALLEGIFGTLESLFQEQEEEQQLE